MRYVILYRRGRNDWTRLEPFVHAKVYERPEVDAAIQTLVENPAFEAVSLRLTSEGEKPEQFNVIRDLTGNPDSFEVTGGAAC